jgi:hypothetical protein
VTPERLALDLAAANSMLMTAQEVVDEGLLIAAILVALADGKDPERLGFSHDDAVEIARRMIRSRPKVQLARYLFDPAMAEGRPTAGGILRVISRWGEE